MKCFFLLLSNEFKLFRSAIPIHLVGFLQPTVMFLLMSVILVHPTFDMNVAAPQTEIEQHFIKAMGQVKSPIGLPYIQPIIYENVDLQHIQRQIITFEMVDDTPVAIQHFGLIDSNIVKNFRNRLTATTLHLWNEALGYHAITIVEHPWLPKDIPYPVYFGMAMLPLAAFVASSFVGSVLTTQDFEQRTILEYQISPINPLLIITARLMRLTLTGLVSAGILCLAIGFSTGYWPSSLLSVLLILTAIGIIASSIGMTAGMFFKKTIPAFIISLTLSFGTWIMGNAFGLASGFSATYQNISKLLPNTYAVEMLFTQYYQFPITNFGKSMMILIGYCLVSLAIVITTYNYQIRRQK